MLDRVEALVESRVDIVAAARKLEWIEADLRRTPPQG